MDGKKSFLNLNKFPPSERRAISKVRKSRSHACALTIYGSSQPQLRSSSWLQCPFPRMTATKTIIEAHLAIVMQHTISLIQGGDKTATGQRLHVSYQFIYAQLVIIHCVQSIPAGSMYKIVHCLWKRLGCINNVPFYKYVTHILTPIRVYTLKHSL